MSGNQGSESGSVDPLAERSGGDEVAGEERSERAADPTRGGFSPRGAPRRTARTVSPEAARIAAFTGEQRLLLLDAWMRSKLPATEFAALVGVTSTTLYGWRKRFEESGPAGLMGHKRGQRGSQLPEPTRRAILMMKQTHPDWGQDRIHDMLIRTDGLEASAGAVQRVLLEAGYEVEEAATRPHPPKQNRFERTRPNELWQTDLFSFLLKRQRRRLHLVAYLDDFSRFVVGFGLHASASGTLVREIFEVSIANFGAPEEVLTDNGAQYHTWRGKSAFAKLCERRGVRQIVASPRRPQTLGKIERFWGTLWRELVEGAVFRDLDEARTRIGHFVNYYNFQRTHQGIDGLAPADRYFEASPEVRQSLQKRVANNAQSLAVHGEPRKQIYLTGRVGGESISLHSEGDKVVLTGAEGVREEVDLKAPGRRVPAEPAGEEAPGTSVLDGVLEDLSVLDESATEESAEADREEEESA
ncbi:MAG: DDE-type integrase/transposase/recombinase [Planctomycetota bacterium]|jgi:transposase InsO family protein